MQSIVLQEPNIDKLEILYDKNKARFSKEYIFNKWVEVILPETPKISLEQFINYTRTLSQKEKDKEIEEKSNEPFENIMEIRKTSLMDLENKISGVRMDLVEEAEQVMRIHKEDGMPLKERYFALNAILGLWGKLQKEKEIAIKAHAEKRESVGLFAKLLNKANSGEFTMEDIEKMKQNKDGNS